MLNKSFQARSSMLRFVGVVVAIALSIALVGVAAQHQAAMTAPAAGQAPAAKGPKAITSEQLVKVHKRVALVTDILNRHQAEAEAIGLASGWRQAYLETLLPLSLESLQRVRSARNLNEVSTLADEEKGSQSIAATTPTAITPTAIGSDNTDLVYVPITPCRFVDTRITGGRIVGAPGTRGFDLANSGSSYGGSAACNPTVLFGVGENSFGALAINFTIVDPVGAPGFGAIKPDAGAPVTSAINWYEAGAVIANQGIFTMDQTTATNEFIVEASQSPNVVLDIFGAFVAPEATALGVTTEQTAWSVAAPGNTFNVTATCPAGFSVTGGGWNHNSGNFDAVSVTQSSKSGGNGWQCRGVHTGAGAITQSGFCEAICSRIPGR